MKRSASIALVILISLLAVGTATPAMADGEVSITTAGQGTESCNATTHNDWGDAWVFEITGVGGSTAIKAPDSISVSLPYEGTTVVPLTTVEGTTAFYVVRSQFQLSGFAEALIDPYWDQQANKFFLLSRPCAQLNITLSAS